MPDSKDCIRLTVKLNPEGEAELTAELERLGKYYRSRRLVALARLGLAVERGQFALPSVDSSPLPPAETRAASPNHPAGPPAPQSGEDGNGEEYTPNLDDLWATGIMG